MNKDKKELVSKTSEVTMIKKKYAGHKVTTLKELFEIMEEKDEKNSNSRFVLSGYILGFSNTNPEKIFKKYCSECKNVLVLDDPKNTCCDEPMTVINHVVLHFKDKSLENTERYMN